MKKTNHLLPFAALVGLVLTAATVHAGTLISDDFSGDSATDLVGTTADVGGTWTGPSNTDMKADGSLIAGSERSAYQAVTIAAGEVYTLSADVTLDTGSGAFIAIGFANSPGDGAGTIWDDANPSAWMYLNAPAWGIRRIAGPDLGGEVQIGNTVFDTPVNLKVVLDTTNAANYEATWFIDGVEEDSTFIGAPSLTHVFINKHSGSTSGTVDNFLLTDGGGGPDTTAPTLTSTDPADEASDVAIGADLVATFDETVQAGTGFIRIMKTAGDVEVEAIDVTDVTAPGTVTFSGANVTIDPTNDLVGGVEYYVLIDPTAIQDTAPVPGPNVFAGITVIGDWSFTADGTAPMKDSMGPMAGATEVSTSADLTLTFDEDVQLGTGTITIHLASDDSVVETINVTTPGAVVISGGEVTIVRSVVLANLTDYYVNASSGAFTDLSGNAYAGISGDTAWTFTTEAFVSPPAGALVFDDFSGNSATNLVGTTADVGGTWTGAANTDMKADGSISSGSERTAYQAVTVASGEVYTLSADVTLDTGSSDFIAIGFANSPGDGAGTIWSDANPYAWMYLNFTTWGIRRIAGPDLAGEVQIGDTVFDTPVNLKVVVDTTNPADYEATWFIDGVEKDSASIGAPSLTHVFIYKHTGTSGTVDNFTLTSGVEAAPLVLNITQSGGALDFEWNSLDGMQYDLVTSTDLTTPVATWPVYDEDGPGGKDPYENIPATGTTTMLTGVLKDGPARFFALIEEETTP